MNQQQPSFTELYGFYLEYTTVHSRSEILINTHNISIYSCNLVIDLRPV